jgi:hypothetical protein
MHPRVVWDLCDFGSDPSQALLRASSRVFSEPFGKNPENFAKLLPENA